MYEIALVAVTLCAFVAFYIRTVIVQPMLNMNASVLHIGKMLQELQVELTNTQRAIKRILAENNQTIHSVQKLATMIRLKQLKMNNKIQDQCCLTCGIFFQTRNMLLVHLERLPDHKV